MFVLRFDVEIGFCAPGGFYKGLQGHPKQLGILSEQGYQFIITDGAGRERANYELLSTL